MQQKDVKYAAVENLFSCYKMVLVIVLFACKQIKGTAKNYLLETEILMCSSLHSECHM